MHDTTLHSLTSNNIPCLTRQQVDDMQLKEPILTPLFLSFFLSLSHSVLSSAFFRNDPRTTTRVHHISAAAFAHYLTK
jgi:hypothetical protein